MAGKFRCVHTLNGGNAITKIATMGYGQRIFKYIRATVQIIKKEISAGITGAFVVTQTILVFVLA